MTDESETLSLNEENLKKLQDCLCKHQSLPTQDVITAFGATEPTSAMHVLWALCGESFDGAPEVYYGDARKPVLYQPSLYDWADLPITKHAFPEFLILEAPVSIENLRQLRLFAFDKIFTCAILSHLMLWLFDWSRRATPQIGCADQRKMYPAWLLLHRCRSEQPSLVSRFRELYHSRKYGRAFQTQLHIYIEETCDAACLKFLVDAGFWNRDELMSFVEGIHRTNDVNRYGGLLVDLFRHGYLTFRVRGLPKFRALRSHALFRADVELVSYRVVPMKNEPATSDRNPLLRDAKSARRRWSFKPILETLVVLLQLGLPVLVAESTVRYVHPLRTASFTLWQLYGFAESVAKALRRRQ